jgi:hypothetical protein
MDGRADPAPPAARQDGLLVESVGDETVVYDVESKEAHALGRLAAAVFAGSDGRRSLAELAALAAKRIGQPVTEDEVWDALIQLEQRNLLKPPAGGISRRGFVRTGAAIAASAPLVTSLAMPSIASAASCPTTLACGNNDNKCKVGGVFLTRTCTADCNECKCATKSGQPCPNDPNANCKSTVNTTGFCGWV